MRGGQRVGFAKLLRHKQIDIEKDLYRSDYLKDQGFRILRFWDHEVLNPMESVLNKIVEALNETPPLPSPLDARIGFDGWEARYYLADDFVIRSHTLAGEGVPEGRERG